MLLAILAAVCVWAWAIAAVAQERIETFDIDIDVERSGDLVVTETLTVVVEGQQIKRGIFRELPRRYTYDGVKLPYDYELLSVTRDGRPEPYLESSQGNAVTWRVGSADVMLEPRTHVYELTYRVPEQVRHHDDKDEVYWNATGTYWDFPITRATATIRFPDGAEIIEAAAYTGARGSERQDASISSIGSTVVFETTRSLASKQGLTVAASVAKGVIAPMSEARAQRLWWIRNGAWVVLGGGGTLLLAYFLWAWNRVGRDPVKPPVFPRYRAPKGYSPAMVHVLHNRGTKGMGWLTAQIMELAVRDKVAVHVDDGDITVRKTTRDFGHGDGARLMNSLFEGRNIARFDGKPDPVLHNDIMEFKAELTERLAKTYYKRNLTLWVLGLFMAIVLVLFALILPIGKSVAFLGLTVAIAVMVFVFLKLMAAPTPAGAELDAEIEGFKLYLDTAEADRINTANPLGDRPPLMSLDLYERFLPYAIALGVEEPWTEQFRHAMPQAAAEYAPTNLSGSDIGRIGSNLDFNTAVAAALTAGVAAAAPVSQSSGGGFSSGSGGGGFSGGGGGGGGGGGW